VLRLMRLSDIVSTAPGKRSVFMDLGQREGGFSAFYFREKWHNPSLPPIHHADGTTLSFADGHTEYWHWSRESVKIPRELRSYNGIVHLGSAGRAGYTPSTKERLADLHKTQKAVWDRLGYTPSTGSDDGL